MWITLIIMLVSYFLSKKSGASTGQAAAIAGVAGAATYYTATETDWGKSTLGAIDDKIDGWINPTTKTVVPSGNVRVVTDSDGNAVTGVDGKPLYEDSANPATKSADGSWLNTLTSTAGGVLKSWGGAGTAAVIGTAGVVSSDSPQKYVPWVLGGLAVWLLLK